MTQDNWERAEAKLKALLEAGRAAMEARTYRDRVATAETFESCLDDILDTLQGRFKEINGEEDE